MNKQILSQFAVGDTTVLYRHDPATGQVGLELYPTAMTDTLVPRRESLAPSTEFPRADKTPAAWAIDSLAHVKIIGQPYGGVFAQGRTMRSGPSNQLFHYESQSVETSGDRTTILTTLDADAGYRIEHRLSWYVGDVAMEVATTFVNGSSRPVTLEMLTSFSLGNITPFAADDAPGRLQIHRFRSVWSAEGRLDTQTLEQLHLERSWSGSAQFSERFGQVGSMPVRGWFPFVAAEDTTSGVVWGANLAWAGSWQMEVFRQHDPVCLSGGLADREFGHWTKTLADGESLTTPTATIACVNGDLDDLCDRLTAAQTRAADTHPAIEQDLPIVFNEWCTTWGNPSHERVVGIADKLCGSPVKYLVIDAGWYKTDGTDWGSAQGDWNPSRRLFPDGLAATARAIRDRGLIPGLWFEMETVGSSSVAFSLVDHLLKRDGIPIQAQVRRFWDLNDAFALDYLTERVIGLLESCGFGYLKVDYNETIGIGTDGAESLGEGLRRQIHGVYRLFDRIRERLPNLVIENCSSGGHRLEPSMIGRTAMCSFSDAHETAEIPIIAANLHRLMLPRQSQIWAVLHPADSDTRLVYSLAATFLGRMCLSGDIDGLSADQWKIVRDAEELYGLCAPIIKAGTTRRFGQIGESWRHPTGWQAVVRTGCADEAMVVLHTFASAPERIEVPLPGGDNWTVSRHFSVKNDGIEIVGNRLVWHPKADFEASVALLKTREESV